MVVYSLHHDTTLRHCKPKQSFFEPRYNFNLAQYFTFIKVEYPSKSLILSNFQKMARWRFSKVGTDFNDCVPIFLMYCTCICCSNTFAYRQFWELEEN